MPADSIIQNALHARFETKQNKGRPGLRRIDNIKEGITSLGLTLRGALNWTRETYEGGDLSFVPLAARAGVRN